MTASSSGVPATESKYLLNLEPALDRLHRQAKVFDKMAELAKFASFRRRMDSVQKIQIQVIEPSGDRLIGGEHELFDDLMALGVVDPGSPFDLARLVQIQLDVGHVHGEARRA